MRVGRLVGLNHVALEVGSIDEALAFWERLFGPLSLRGRLSDVAWRSSTWATSSSRSLSRGRSRATSTATSGSSWTTRRRCARRRSRPGSRSRRHPRSISTTRGATCCRSSTTARSSSRRRREILAAMGLRRAREDRGGARRAARQGDLGVARDASAAECAGGELPRVDSLAGLGHARPRPVDRPHVRPDAACVDRALHVRHGPALGRAGRRLGPDLPLRGLGRRGRHRRRAALPPRDELGRGARRVVGPVRDLAWRPRRVGRDRRRLRRRRARREAVRRRRLAARGLPRSGAAARSGPRPARQLVEPGAVRQADRPSVGASRSTRSTARSSTSTARRSIRPSSTSCCGTSRSPRCSSSSSNDGSGPARPGCSPRTSRSTASAAS